MCSFKIVRFLCLFGGVYSFFFISVFVVVIFVCFSSFSLNICSCSGFIRISPGAISVPPYFFSSPYFFCLPFSV